MYSRLDRSEIMKPDQALLLGVSKYCHKWLLETPYLLTFIKLKVITLSVLCILTWFICSVSWLTVHVPCRVCLFALLTWIAMQSYYYWLLQFVLKPLIRATLQLHCTATTLHCNRLLGLLPFIGLYFKINCFFLFPLSLILMI